MPLRNSSSRRTHLAPVDTGELLRHCSDGLPTFTAPKRIVVMGSGIAGLIAALELSAKHDVTLVTKSELMESNTRYAQGGIAAAMFADDSVAEHVADTLRAGAGLCRVEAV